MLSVSLLMDSEVFTSLIGVPYSNIDTYSRLQLFCILANTYNIELISFFCLTSYKSSSALNHQSFSSLFHSLSTELVLFRTNIPHDDSLEIAEYDQSSGEASKRVEATTLELANCKISKIYRGLWKCSGLCNSGRKSIGLKYLITSSFDGHCDFGIAVWQLWHDCYAQ
jgi:hypothetical protein